MTYRYSLYESASRWEEYWRYRKDELERDLLYRVFSDNTWTVTFLEIFSNSARNLPEAHLMRRYATRSLEEFCHNVATNFVFSTSIHDNYTFSYDLTLDESETIRIEFYISSYPTTTVTRQYTTPPTLDRYYRRYTHEISAQFIINLRARYDLGNTFERRRNYYDINWINDQFPNIRDIAPFYSSGNVHTGSRKPRVLGDATCINNALSPYIQCAINPTGKCSECKDYEPKNKE